MIQKNKRFEEILDLLAIRLVTKTELNCYETDLNSQFTIKLDFDWNKRFGK